MSKSAVSPVAIKALDDRFTAFKNDIVNCKMYQNYFSTVKTITINMEFRAWYLYSVFIIHDNTAYIVRPHFNGTEIYEAIATNINTDTRDTTKFTISGTNGIQFSVAQYSTVIIIGGFESISVT